MTSNEQCSLGLHLFYTLAVSYERHNCVVTVEGSPKIP